MTTELTVEQENCLKDCRDQYIKINRFVNKNKFEKNDGFFTNQEQGKPEEKPVTGLDADIPQEGPT